MQPLQHLINKVSDMILAEVLSGVDYPVQISFHQLGYNVVIFVSTLGLGKL
jgi:hypothetical protein